MFDIDLSEGSYSTSNEKPVKDYSKEAKELLMVDGYWYKNEEYWSPFDTSVIPDESTVALIDGDWLAFTSTSQEMERYLEVEHDGEVNRFKGYRDYQAWCIENNIIYDPDNASRKQYNHDKALIYAKASVKKKVRNIIEKTGATHVVIFFGSTGNHRDSLPLPDLKSDRINCWIYKGQRDSDWTPNTLNTIKDWSMSKWMSHWSVGQEADDSITIAKHSLTERGIKAYTCGIDKDYNQDWAGGLFLIGHQDKPEYFEDTEENRLGWLYIEKKESGYTKVKGHGDMFLAYQILTHDDADNYHAKTFLKQYGTCNRFGDSAVVKYLSQATTRRELWQLVYDKFKNHLPEKLDYVDCFGEWHYNCTPLYFCNLYYKCARMMKTQDDDPFIVDLFDELGVIYE